MSPAPAAGGPPPLRSAAPCRAASLRDCYNQTKIYIYIYISVNTHYENNTIVTISYNITYVYIYIYI